MGNGQCKVPKFKMANNGHNAWHGASSFASLDCVLDSSESGWSSSPGKLGIDVDLSEPPLWWVLKPPIKVCDLLALGLRRSYVRPARSNHDWRTDEL